MNWRIFFLGWLVAAATVRADQAMELARIHMEVIGGKERIEALGAIKATGHVLTGGKRVRFALWAARPNRLRLETSTEGRTIVQASDGVEPPWRADVSVVPSVYSAMPEAEGKLFTTDAEFDDPLVAGKARGFVFDYSGEAQIGGRKMIRLLVTRKLTHTFALYLDAETYFIHARVDTRTSPGGRRVEITTRYEDYRPVNGVLLPYRVAVLLDGKPTQVTVIENIEANPPVPAEAFARPKQPAKEK